MLKNIKHEIEEEIQNKNSVKDRINTMDIKGGGDGRSDTFA